MPDSSESDPRYFAHDSGLFDRAALPPAVLEASIEVLEALRRWRDADARLAAASRRFMRLNETDMRAIRALLRAAERGETMTPKDIAHAVQISSASTTKLIDRLEAAGHVRRVAHPRDRRTSCIEVTASTAAAARGSVGAQHARRMAAVAGLSASDRVGAIRFLDAMAAADEPIGVLADSPAGMRDDATR